MSKHETTTRAYRKTMRSKMQGILNTRRQEQLTERGIEKYWMPLTVAERVQEQHLAFWNRYYRLWVLRAHLSSYEREYHLRRARLCLEYATHADRPRLP